MIINNLNFLSKDMLNYIIKNGGRLAINFCVATLGTFVGKTLFRVLEEFLSYGCVKKPQPQQEEEPKPQPWYKRWFKKSKR